MADEPLPPPDPSITPLPVPEGSSMPDEHAMRRKAILGTTLFTLIAIGFILYDPLGLFHYDVEVSEDLAAPPTFSRTPRPSLVPAVGGITAVCEQSMATIEWSEVPNAQVNGLARREDDGSYHPVFFEGGDAPFYTFIFTDATVQSGKSYSYRLITGTLAAEPTVMVTCQ